MSNCINKQNFWLVTVENNLCSQTTSVNINPNNAELLVVTVLGMLIGMTFVSIGLMLIAEGIINKFFK